MQLFHDVVTTGAIFDDEHMIAYGGPAPAMRLAGRCGLAAAVWGAGTPAEQTRTQRP
ncbi:hypothetical protein [Nonomuraea coxensis]|uniref:hypothetical protein n=1 Tax=Nonomuraea coxensis TaxID=404386 RepID=UPI0012FA0301|nr:hypothetical protein [Nonomuraea coxensis]